VKCQSCQAITVFDPSRAAQRVISADPRRSSRSRSRRGRFARSACWNSRFLRPRCGMRSARGMVAMVCAEQPRQERAHGHDSRHLYPLLDFDAQVSADWTAMSGDYYYVTGVLYGFAGKSQTRQVRKDALVSSSGHVDHFFDDELVPANEGRGGSRCCGRRAIPHADRSKAYDPGFLTGWTVEQYQIVSWPELSTRGK
jgi:hypothetical protein